MQPRRQFTFDLEVECFEKASPDGKERRIGGIVSTNDMDRQGEILLQEGLDFEPFLKGGWFNDNHSSDTDAAVGYPEVAELRDLGGGRKGWYVEGFMLKGHEKADSLWNMMKALQKADRKLGFSVEGSIDERDPENPGTVRKATVREVAITRCPVNTSTALNVLAKSLGAGHAVSDPGVSPGEGFPLRTESLEGGETEDEKKKKAKRAKRFGKSEAVAHLRSLHPALTVERATEIVEYALRWHPAPSR